MTGVTTKSFFAFVLAAITASAGHFALAQAVQTDDEVNAIIRRLAPIAGQTVATPQENVILNGTPLAQDGPRQQVIVTQQPQVVVSRPAPVIVSPPPQVVVVEAAPTHTFVVDGYRIAVDSARALDMDVFFPLDSADLTETAQASLHALGRALESPELQPFKYLIAGHTDASGPDAYNQSLSQRRAQSVRDFLVRNYLIDPARLISTGFGEARLRLPSEPYSALNRRVEVALVQSYTMIVE